MTVTNFYEMGRDPSKLPSPGQIVSCIIFTKEEFKTKSLKELTERKGFGIYPLVRLFVDTNRIEFHEWEDSFFKKSNPSFATAIKRPRIESACSVAPVKAKKKSVVSVKTAVGKDREHGFSTRVFSLRAKRGRSSCSTHAVDSLLVAFDAMQALPRGDVRRNIT